LQITVEIIDEISLIDQQLEKLLQISDSNRTELERMIEQVGKQHQRMRGMVEKKGSVLRDSSPFFDRRSEYSPYNRSSQLVKFNQTKM